MYEVEMKVRADADIVRGRLTALVSATRSRAVFQEDTYYDAPHRDFAATDEALRVRREVDLDEHAPTGVDAVADAFEAGTLAGGRTEDEQDFESRVTYKGPLVDDGSKTREEFETGIGDGATMAAVLEHLGFAPAATVAKRREFWTVDDPTASGDGVTVTVDDVRDLGTFVEVEIETDAIGVDRARERVAGVLGDLDLDPDEQIRTSYLGLLLDGSAEH